MVIYNVFVNALHVHDLKTPLLSQPYHVKKERKMSNSAVQDLLGGFIHTLNTVMHGSFSKEHCATKKDQQEIHQCISLHRV